MRSSMLIICDFDGTVTARDTNSTLARRFAPDAYADLEGRLASRELTLRQVLSAEFEHVSAPLDHVVDEALKIPFRDGFAQFLDAADASGARVVLLSSGFHELIEPMLAREGLGGRVPLLANRISFDGRGGRVTWRELPTCELCAEPCKRHDVARLRHQHAGSGNDPVVFVGDGFSDRCGAESADRVLARDSLASYLDERGHPFEPWDDFDDVARMLGLETGEA
jgi:2-hydroxy-3-keto-5-methylthiopentenyl-1-phosphate phosphatase